MRSFFRARDGVTAVEFAFVAGPLFLLIVGTVEIGRVVWMQNALNYSVEQAARCGAVDSTICATAGQVESFAAAAAGAAVSASIFTASDQSCGSDVTASYTMAISAPFISYSIPLSAHACYPK